MPANPPTAWNVVFYVYMMTNAGRTTLYIGVTKSLEKRVTEHRNRKFPNSFTSRYRLNRLVWYQRFADARDAIAREKQIKRWSRAKKEFLIHEMNPTWEDLAMNQLGLPPVSKSGDREDND